MHVLVIVPQRAVRRRSFTAPTLPSAGRPGELVVQGLVVGVMLRLHEAFALAAVSLGVLHAKTKHGLQADLRRDDDRWNAIDGAKPRLSAPVNRAKFHFAELVRDVL